MSRKSNIDVHAHEACKDSPVLVEQFFTAPLHISPFERFGPQLLGSRSVLGYSRTSEAGLSMRSMDWTNCRMALSERSYLELIIQKNVVTRS